MSHLTNLQSRMKAGEVEAVLVSSEINQRYLTGLNYTDGYVLVLPEAAYLLADFRYIEVARATAGSAGIEVVRRGTDDRRLPSDRLPAPCQGRG